ncbi:MAG: YqgE/AlgH family protein [Bacteroidota bacterium]|nr:YqgE/AlgH family protein [Bacteroidota bacterium]MDP4206123.1 YqgE/AlgH family protein [Bacteroidota bacterium]
MKSNFDIFRIETNNIPPKKGRILIAEPFLPGTYFNRSIVLLVECSHDGAVGFILNKPVDVAINSFNKQFPGYEKQLFIGGPVNPEYLYFIHTLGDKIPGSLHVIDNLYWGGSFDVLSELIQKNQIKQSDVRFFLGYSGWAAGQLEQELKEDSWIVSNIQINQVMDCFADSWTDAVKEVGGKYKLWENYPENPTLN